MIEGHFFKQKGDPIYLHIIMFGLFKKKTEKEKLQMKHKQLLEEAYRLSTSDRMASHKKYAEAQKLQEKIDNID